MYTSRTNKNTKLGFGDDRAHGLLWPGPHCGFPIRTTCLLISNLVRSQFNNLPPCREVFVRENSALKQPRPRRRRKQKVGLVGQWGWVLRQLPPTPAPPNQSLVSRSLKIQRSRSEIQIMLDISRLFLP